MLVDTDMELVELLFVNERQEIKNISGQLPLGTRQIQSHSSHIEADVTSSTE